MQESDLLNLYDQYADIVYRLAVSYIGSAQDSEDIVQTVFLKLLDGTASPLPGKERAYLTQITINCCKDFLRSFRRKRTLSIDETLIVWEDNTDRELFHAVMTLPPKYRIVIHLHYYEGYSFQEIADFLKISSSAVSMRMHRARKLLKKQLRRDDV